MASEFLTLSNLSLPFRPVASLELAPPVLANLPDGFFL